MFALQNEHETLRKLILSNHSEKPEITKSNFGSYFLFWCIVLGDRKLLIC